MIEESKFEYLVRTCPIEDTASLQELLNNMSEEGWELYSLYEAETEDGFQYNCIFSRAVDDFYNENEDVSDVVDLKSRMEKIFHFKDDPYEKAKTLQNQLVEKNLRINEIKQLLDSSSVEDREKNNQEISKKLSERNALKNKFSEALSPAGMYDRLHQEILTIVVSEELVDLIDNDKNGELLIESIRVRQNLADRLGYVIPSVKFVSSDKMGENQYSINIRGFKAISGFAYPDYRMFKIGQANIDKKPAGSIEGIDPITGQKVFWIQEKKTKSFWDKGLSPAQVISSQLEFVVSKYVDEILSYTDVLNYISLLGEGNLFIAEELLQGAFSLSDMRYIFVNLIREKVSVKDVTFVFEKLNDLMKYDYKIEETVDNLRILFGKQLCSAIADNNNFIYGIIPSSEQDEKLKKALCKKSKGKYLVNNNDVKSFVKFVQEKVKNCDCDISNMAVIVSPELRLPVFYLFEQVIPELRVLSEEEIPQEFNVEAV